MARKRNNNLYIQDVELTGHVMAFVEDAKLAEAAGRPRPRINNYIGKAILDMATGMSKRANFVGYTYKEEMVGAALEDVIRYLKNYDYRKSQLGPNRGAYSYINRIIWLAFLRVMKKEKKEYDGKQTLIMSAGIIEDIASVQDHDDRVYGNGYLDQVKSDADDYYKMGAIPERDDSERVSEPEEKSKKAQKVSALEEFFE